MAFPAVFQGTLELMIFVLWWQFFSTGKAPDDIFQLADIFAAFDDPINVPFELGVASDGSHCGYIPRSSKSS